MSDQTPPPPPPPGGSIPPPPPPPAAGGPDPASYGGTPQPFSVGNAFNYGWTKFQAYLGPLLIAMVAFFAVGAVIYLIFNIAMSALALSSGPVCTGGTYDYTTGTYIPLTCSGGGLAFFSAGFFLIYGIQMVVMFLYSYLVQAGVTRAGLAITYGKPIEFKTLVSSDKVGQVLIGGLIMSVATAIGYMLCIIPGLIIAFFGQFFIFFIIDKELGAVDAIKASVAFVNKNLGSLIGLFLAEMLAIIIGALLCGIGLIVAIPVVVIAQSFAYRTLRGEQVAA